MLQWSLPLFFVFFFEGVGNAAQSTQIQSTQAIIAPQSQANPASGKLDPVKPEVTKLAEVNPCASQANKPVAPMGMVPSPQANDVELLPHRATYSIALDRNYEEEDIVEANGQMTIQLAKVGDGWAIEQKSTLHIYYKDGSAEQVLTTLATYESMDGLKYSFNARTLRADQEETISGDAILASKGGAGIVTYQQPDVSTVQLPVGTIFPTQHLIYMLQAAMKGQKVVSNIVFDGSSETHEPVQVDTVLGASQDPKLALTNKDLLQAKKVWPMRMAVYAVDSNGPEADYEINQHVLDRGIIRDMTLDYGTFKVKAVLNQVEVFS
ncbi:MAG: hypothetical protein K0R76_1011 [Alphaproteobacteria bacterium]|jgi:hypothetical protein|nr:hypothetical protein [Alphaproteobacteria bacterium]